MNYYKSIPTDAGPLIELGGNMIPGLTDYGVALKLTITPAELQAQLTAFIGDNNAFAAGRSALQEASNAVVATLGALLGWITDVKNDLIGSFGPLWNSQWVQVGFQSPSIATPSTRTGQATLAGMMIGFYTASPGYEDPAKNLTAAFGKTLQAAIAAAQAAFTAANKVMKDLNTAWDGSYAALLKTERDVLKLLQVALAADDPRWLDFGLALPGTPSTPGQPVNVSAHLDGSGAIVVACDAVPLATRYRFRMRLPGDANYRLAASSPAPMGSITGVLPGTTAEIIVQAVNGSLQGVASEPIQFTVPPVTRTAEPKRAALIEEAPAVEKHANGNGNGHHANGNVPELARR